MAKKVHVLQVQQVIQRAGVRPAANAGLHTALKKNKIKAMDSQFEKPPLQVL